MLGAAIIRTAIFLIGFAGLVGQRRFRRAWLWWVALQAAILGAGFTVWAVPASFAVLVAVTVDWLRLRRRPIAAPAPGLPTAELAGHRPARRRVHVAGLVIATVAASAASRAWVTEAFKIPSAGMEPTVAIGDHLLADKLSLRWRPPAAGDIVIFRNPCSPQSTFIQRVVAIAGDTVEIRCNRLHINGTATPDQPVAGACTYVDVDERSGQWTTESCTRHREQRGGVRHDVIHAEAPTGAPSAHDFPSLTTSAPPFQCSIGTRPDADTLGTVVTAATAATACAPQAHYVVPPGQLFVLGDNRDNSADSRVWGPVPVDHVIGRPHGIWWSHTVTGVRWDRLGPL